MQGTVMASLAIPATEWSCMLAPGPREGGGDGSSLVDIDIVSVRRIGKSGKRLMGGLQEWIWVEDFPVRVGHLSRWVQVQSRARWIYPKNDDEQMHDPL